MRKSAMLALAFLAAACSSQEKGEEAKASLVSAEGGASIDKAAALKVGTAVAGEIKPGGTSHFYRFDYEGKLRDIALVRLENQSSTLKPDIKVYNHERSQLVEKYDSTPGANVEHSLTLEPGKSIYVEVLPYGSAGAYRLSVVAKKAYDANEPNDDQLRPTTLQFGSAIEGNILDEMDSDWFHVTPATTGKVSVGFENLSATLRPDVLVYSAAKSQLVEKWDGTGGAGLDFNVDVTPGQDFYIQVKPYGGSGPDARYRLSTRPATLASDMASAIKAKGAIDLYGVYFDTDQTFVKPQSANTLAEVASLLKADPTLRLEVAGHTDNAGAKDYNMRLSQGRADAVVAALVGQYGIDPARLQPKGYGDTKPVAPNADAAGMAKSRRVELRRL